MRILLSNDDGIQADGLEALVQVLCPCHEVIVSAPFRQQSGMSQALTVGKAMELLLGEPLCSRYGIEAWAVDGTPTDAVKLYLEALSNRFPDIVISGINHGANLATDILYSGTVGAATEGYLHGLSSLAVSLDAESKLSFQTVAKILANYLKEIVDTQQSPFFYNINFPRELRNGTPSFVMGRQGRRDYKNAFLREERADGRVFYVVQGEIFDTDKSEPTDIYAVEQGYISVTPLMTDRTDYIVMENKLDKKETT